MGKYARTLAELSKEAVLFWPRELLEKEASVSVLPLLLKTQDKFLSVLKLADSGPEIWKQLVDVSEEMRGNLFLKHLMVSSQMKMGDLNKLMPLEAHFASGRMTYVWRKATYVYEFDAILSRKKLSKSLLNIDVAHLIAGCKLNARMEDIIMLLLHGASAIGDTLPKKERRKCLIGGLMGNDYELENHIREKFVLVK